MSVEKEIETILENLEPAWNQRGLQNTLDVMIEEGFIKEMPDDGDTVRLPVHIDLLSGKTLQCQIPVAIEVDENGRMSGELVDRKRILWALIEGAKEAEKHEEDTVAIELL